MSETLLRKVMRESGHLHSIQSRAAQYALAILAVAVVTGVMAPFAGHINSTTVALVLLLVILLAAAAFESGPALVASFIGYYVAGKREVRYREFTARFRSWHT